MILIKWLGIFVLFAFAFVFLIFAGAAYFQGQGKVAAPETPQTVELAEDAIADWIMAEFKIGPLGFETVKLSPDPKIEVRVYRPADKATSGLQAILFRKGIEGRWTFLGRLPYPFEVTDRLENGFFNLEVPHQELINPKLKQEFYFDQKNYRVRVRSR